MTVTNKILKPIIEVGRSIKSYTTLGKPGSNFHFTRSTYYNLGIDNSSGSAISKFSYKFVKYSTTVGGLYGGYSYVYTELSKIIPILHDTTPEDGIRYGLKTGEILFNLKTGGNIT